MDFDTYQTEASKTAIYPEHAALDYLIPALASEAGELAGHWAKAIRDDYGILTDERRALILKEAGDVLWMVSQIATELGVTLESVAEANLDKLRDRQARGVLSGAGDNR